MCCECTQGSPTPRFFLWWFSDITDECTVTDLLNTFAEPTYHNFALLLYIAKPCYRIWPEWFMPCYDIISIDSFMHFKLHHLQSNVSFTILCVIITFPKPTVITLAQLLWEKQKLSVKCLSTLPHHPSILPSHHCFTDNTSHPPCYSVSATSTQARALCLVEEEMLRP